MEVIKKAKMPDGTPIQIEDWSMNYSFLTYGSTVAAYPKSKASLKHWPRLGESFRLDINCKTHEQAETVMQSLVNGESKLIDYKNDFDTQCEGCV